MRSLCDLVTVCGRVHRAPWGAATGRPGRRWAKGREPGNLPIVGYGKSRFSRSRGIDRVPCSPWGALYTQSLCQTVKSFFRAVGFADVGYIYIGEREGAPKKEGGEHEKKDRIVSGPRHAGSRQRDRPARRGGGGRALRGRQGGCSEGGGPHRRHLRPDPHRRDRRPVRRRQGRLGRPDRCTEGAGGG